MSKLRFGIVGCGRISVKHIRVLKDLAEDAEIAGVCDIDASKAQKAAQETGAKAYTDYLEMVGKENLDVLNILTWSGNHASIGIDCAGLVSNLVIEKPMALRLRDADTLIDTCVRTNTRLFVVKQNRYNPPVTAVKKALDQGRFGKLILGTVRVRWCRPNDYYEKDAWRGTWAWDGGVLTNQASHHIDLLTWLFGPVESVFAKTGTFVAPIEAEDTGVVVFKFRSGALGIVEATTCIRPRNLEGSVTVIGEKGTVEIGGIAVNQIQTWQFTERADSDAEVASLSTAPEDVYGFGHLALLKEVIRCIRSGQPFMIDGVEGRRSLELINAIYESVERKQEVAVSFTPTHARIGELAHLPAESLSQ